ncbi:MAG TPA: CAP domain-containing protein [Solirubrobacteraceae bacterium]|nr:CAP domain-containing protein [Solirubrobacteraceae bacterium]
MPSLALPLAMGATNVHQHRGTVHVRHQAIQRPARKGTKRSCSRHKAHNKRAKRTASCHKHKKGLRRTHKRALHHTSHSRPATASRDCPGANLTPKPGNVEGVVAATLCLINDERARYGAPALIADPHLTSAAAGHSRDMDARHYFEHVSPDGQTLLMRVLASGFIPNDHVGYVLGENIAWGTLWLGTPRSIVRAWMSSPGHRANILDRAYRYTGIGIDPALPSSMSDGRPGGMYTQDFGSITTR